jgi:hypothetical protein
LVAWHEAAALSPVNISIISVGKADEFNFQCTMVAQSLIYNCLRDVYIPAFALDYGKGLAGAVENQNIRPIRLGTKPQEYFAVH